MKFEGRWRRKDSFDRMSEVDSDTVDVRQSRARTARRVRLGYGPKPRTNPRIITPAAVCVGRLGSGSRFVGRIGSGVRVSASNKKSPPVSVLRQRKGGLTT